MLQWFYKDVTARQCGCLGMVNVNGQDNEGVTGLQLAASRGDIQLARTLLEHGALPDLANGSGWTPLLLASWHGHADLAALLLQHRARANQPNRLGVRPLTAAAWGGHLPLVRLLLQHGALLEPGPLDLSPLAAASFQGHCAVVRFLLDCGLDVNHSLPHTGTWENTIALLAHFTAGLLMAGLLSEFN
ncbi:hypothetical protein LAZ67_3006276 [Cordylochernes scorpioides]|uniref:Alpha-latrotoxin n=1 Tax=Cordylochernes scorpioides TaxID=51811 RepID=A0ABY6KFT3_9ARAC|nr:hypothetical protein LAZ67_3006276 [Cordylochernes scorpioides]